MIFHTYLYIKKKISYTQLVHLNSLIILSLPFKVQNREAGVQKLSQAKTTARLITIPHAGHILIRQFAVKDALFPGRVEP